MLSCELSERMLLHRSERCDTSQHAQWLMSADIIGRQNRDAKGARLANLAQLSECEAFLQHDRVKRPSSVPL